MLRKLYSSYRFSLSPFSTRHAHLIKRLFTTTMASGQGDVTKTNETDKKSENLLAKRFVGLEKSIW